MLQVITEEVADMSLRLAHHTLDQNRVQEAEEYAKVALNAKHPVSTFLSVQVILHLIYLNNSIMKEQEIYWIKS